MPLWLSRAMYGVDSELSQLRDWSLPRIESGKAKVGLQPFVGNFSADYEAPYAGKVSIRFTLLKHIQTDPSSWSFTLIHEAKNADPGNMTFEFIPNPFSALWLTFA